MRRGGLRRPFLRHPVVVLVSASVCAAGFLLLGRQIVWLLPQNALGEALFQGYHILWPLLLVTLFRYGWVYRSGDFQETVWAALPFFVLEGGLLFLTIHMAAQDRSALWHSPVEIALGIWMLFGIGFREESLFRGLVVNVLGEWLIRSRRGVWATVLISGILFGLVHLSNYFAGVSLQSVIVQTAAASAVGWALCAAYLRGGNLWCMILVHTITDAASMFYATFQQEGDVIDTLNTLSIVNLTPVIPFTAVTLFLLRRPYCDRIIQRFRAREEGQSGDPPNDPHSPL